MSTGRRLAKRSIIGTRVCAKGPDGLWYSGVIQDVRTPPNKVQQIENNNCINLTPDTRYTVRFDFKTVQKQMQTSSDMKMGKGAAIATSCAATAASLNAAAVKTIISMSAAASPQLINTQDQQHQYQQQQTNNICYTTISSSSPPSSSPLSSDSNMMDTDQNCEQQQQTEQQIADLSEQHEHHQQIISAQEHLQQQQQIVASQQQHVSLLLNPIQTIRRNALIKEYRESELIGPGFRSIMGVQLLPGQKVFLTHNGRETSGDIISHDLQKDDVIVRISTIGVEEPLELRKRLEEVRLLESRRSARLADQDRDTDFARLADMAGDRRRTSHNIDVPIVFTQQQNSRKRRPSYSQDERENFIQFRDENEMEACNAALVLMSLSCSPRSPSIQKGQWNTFGSSPGSSSASWSSGSSSPPLSDDGGSTIPMLHCANSNNNNSNNNNNNIMTHNNNNNRNRTTSLSTSDEGIVMDYGEETPRKRKAPIIYKCTWKGCKKIEMTVEKIELHVRNVHLGPKKPKHSNKEFDATGSDSEDDHEEEFYYNEIGGDDNCENVKAPSPTSPPTLSHRDMARPPHEDPEYQRQIVGNFRQGLLASISQSNIHKSSHGAINIPTSPLAHHNYTWAAQPTPTTISSSSSVAAAAAAQSPVSPMKHARWSPRPSTSSAPYPSPTYVHHNQHHNYSSNNSNNNNNNNTIGSNNTSGSNQQNNHQHHSISIANHHNSHHSQYNSNGTLSQSAPNPSTFHLSPNIHQTTTIVQGARQQQHQTTITSSNAVSRLQQSTTNGISYQQNPQHSSGSTVPNMTSNQHLSTGNSISNSTAAIISSVNRSPQSPNRRTRGENKKCRKVYGMDRKDQWCTQCKWKKACSRFGD